MCMIFEEWNLLMIVILWYYLVKFNNYVEWKVEYDLFVFSEFYLVVKKMNFFKLFVVMKVVLCGGCIVL